MTEPGLFVPRDSSLHRLPAWVKLAGLVVAGVGVALLRDPWQVGVAAAVTAALWAWARVGVRTALAQLRPLVWALAVVALAQLAVAGWQRAVDVVGQIAVLAWLAALVTVTTRTSELVHVLGAACRPLRRVGVDPDRVALMLALVTRSVPVLAGIARQVRDAQWARGLAASPRAFAVPLLVRALRHADALGDALAARGVDD